MAGSPLQKKSAPLGGRDPPAGVEENAGIGKRCSKKMKALRDRA
jgi:hypothetical protein